MTMTRIASSLAFWHRTGQGELRRFRSGREVRVFSREDRGSVRYFWSAYGSGLTPVVDEQPYQSEDEARAAADTRLLRLRRRRARVGGS
jgi:hypothetical protein